MSNTEAMRAALSALEKLAKELLAVRDQLAERGGRPVSNALHQRLWDSSFLVYTDHAIPAAMALRAALAQAEQRRGPTAWAGLTEEEKDTSNMGWGREVEYLLGYEAGMDRAEELLRTKNYDPQPEEPKQHAPGLCLDSGEFIPAEELNKARDQE